MVRCVHEGIAVAALGLLGSLALFAHPDSAQLLVLIALVAAAAAASSARLSPSGIVLGVLAATVAPSRAACDTLPQEETPSEQVLLSRPRR
jgi:hypothetical protein